MPASWKPSRDEWFTIRRVEGAWRVGLRSGISVVVPLLFLLLLGRPELCAYASFGAFTSLYGRSSDYFTRAQMQVSAAIALTMAVVTGVLVGLVGAAWVQVVVAAVIAATGQVIAKAQGYHPPGPLFMVFAYGAISSMPHTTADIARAAVVAGLSAAFSVLVGVAGLSLRPRDVRAAWQEAGLVRPALVHNWQPAWMGLAVLVAGTVAHLAGVGHPYWAMVAALAPLSAPHVTSQVVKGGHRAVGTVLGLVPAWFLLRLELSPAAVALVVAGLQLVTETIVGSNYAIALVSITPMALLVGEIAGRHPAGQLVFDRGTETVIGCLVAFAVTMAGHAIRQRRLAQRQVAAAFRQPPA